MIVETAEIIRHHAILISSPNMLYAQLKSIADQMLLVVNRSICVRVDGDLYSPVTRFLEEHPHRMISEETRRNLTMVRRAEVVTTYEILGREDISELKHCA